MKIAVLGPKGTFASMAGELYNPSLTQVYYKTINDSFMGLINGECDLALIPYENSLDGFVQSSLDLLRNKDIKIIDEIYYDVSFSLVANVDKIEDIKRIYVQFKTKGQCNLFFNAHSDIDVLLTESNMISKEMVDRNIDGEAAIIPSHEFSDKYRFGINNVTDSSINQTRFLILAKRDFHSSENIKDVRCSLIVSSVNDYPGMLYGILGAFYENKINLVSIVSRPNKGEIGKYHFYLEIAGVDNLDVINQTVSQIASYPDLDIFVVGIYRNRDKLHSN